MKKRVISVIVSFVLAFVIAIPAVPFKVELLAADGNDLFANDSSLVVGYDFGTRIGDNMVGSQLMDLSGKGHHGDIIGNPQTFGDDIIGRSLILDNSAGNNTDGVGKYISVPNTVLQDIEDFTLSLSVMVTTTSNWSTLFAVGASGDTGNYLLFNSRAGASPNGIGMTTRSQGITDGRLVSASANRPPNNQWANIVYSQEGNVQKIYLNGNLISHAIGVLPQDIPEVGASQIHGDGPARHLLKDIWREGTRVWIGKNTSWPDPGTVGRVGNFRLHNKALTQEEIRNYYAAEDANKFNLGITDVTADISLPIIGHYGSDITWTSSNPDVISNTGTVNRPTDSEVTVNLTATFTLQEGTAQKTFTVNVLPNNDEGAVAVDKKDLEISKIVKDNFELPQIGAEGSTISWSTSDSDIVSIDGTGANISKIDSHQNVTLTALIEKGNYSDTKTFPITVLGTDNLANHYTFENGAEDIISAKDGVLLNGAKTENGALILDGVNDVVVMPQGWVKDAKSITVSIWLNRNSTQNHQALFNIATSNTSWMILDAITSFSNGAGPALKANIDNLGEQRLYTQEEHRPKIGQWDHLAFTFSGDDSDNDIGNASIFLNGEKVASTPQTATEMSADPKFNFTDGGISQLGDTIFNYIGTSIWPDPNFGGKIDDYKIFYDDMSEVDLKALYETERLELASHYFDIGDLSYVLADLRLPSSVPGFEDVTVTWQSDNTDFLSHNGEVTFPISPAPDAEVTLTATLKCGDKQTTKSFQVTIPSVDAELAIELVTSDLKRDVDYIMTDGYKLPNQGRFSTIIEWQVTSGDAELQDDGDNTSLKKTSSSAEREHIELKASINFAETSKTLEFNNITLLDEYAALVRPVQSDRGIRLQYSDDNGENWIDFNDANPITVRTLGTGDINNVLAPFIMRNKEGSFTVMAQRGNNANTVNNIYLWDSEDLTVLKNERFSRMTFNSDGVKSPRAAYDMFADQYYLFWENAIGSKFYNPSYDMLSFSPSSSLGLTQTSFFPEGVNEIGVTQSELDALRKVYDEGYITQAELASLIDDANIITGESELSGDQYESLYTLESWRPFRKALTAAIAANTVDNASNSGYLTSVYNWLNETKYALVQGETDTDNFLILHYDFSDINDGIVLDKSGNGKDGLLFGDAAVKAEDSSSFPYLDLPNVTNGGGDYLKMPDGILNDANDFTISTYMYIPEFDKQFTWLWAFANDNGAGQPHSQGGDYLAMLPVVGFGFDDNINQGERLKIAYETGGSNTRNYSQSMGRPFGTNRWVHFALVQKGGVLAYYLNGKPAGGGNTGAGLSEGSTNVLRRVGTELSNSSHNTIGKPVWAADNWFSGRVADFRIYNAGLSEEQVKDVYESNPPLMISGVTGESVKTASIFYDHPRKHILVPVAPETDMKNLKLEYTLTGSNTTITPNPMTITDYSSPVSFILSDETGLSVTYTVEVKQYANPVFPEYSADPSIHYFMHEGVGKYYIYPTTSPVRSDAQPGWTFETFYSEDLVNWEQGPVILDMRNIDGTGVWPGTGGSGDHVNWRQNPTGAWAPDMIQRKDNEGKDWYYFYFSFDEKVGVAKSDSPTGPFVAHPLPLLINNMYQTAPPVSIDPHVFVDPQTGDYLLYAGHGRLSVFKLNDDMMSVEPSPWDGISGPGKDVTPDMFTEAISVVYRNGEYHWTWSRGITWNTNYEIRYGVSDSPTEKPVGSAVILTKDESQSINSTGHHDLREIPGTDTWVMAYHRFGFPTARMGPSAFREICIDRVYFDENNRIIPVVPSHEGLLIISDVVEELAVPSGTPFNELPTTVDVMLSNNEIVQIPVDWTDAQDDYQSGEFTTITGILNPPDEITNSKMLKANLSISKSTYVGFSEDSEGVISAVFNINNDTSADCVAHGIFAVYDPNGILQKTVTTTILVDAGEFISKQIDVDIPSGYTGKVFLWDATTLEPLCESATKDSL